MPVAGVRNQSSLRLSMGNTKKYFRNQFRVEKLTLEHENASDFYISCWQQSQSALPLLCVRFLLFVGCLSIVVASLVLTGQSLGLSLWLIFMTHWGIIMITVTSGLACAVSAKAYFSGYIDSVFGLPWYVKLFWVSYNITIPVEFFITAFYYTLLTSSAEEYAVDPVLDLFIHGMNSVAMFVLLVTSKHPSHLLHFWHPVAFMIIYLIFSIIYYFAGGLGPFGDAYIYPPLDWSKPGPTVGVVFGCAVVVIIVNCIVILISLLRNYVTRRYVRKFSTVVINY